MDVDQEIARLVNELGKLLQVKKPNIGSDNLTVLNLRLLGYIYFAPTPPTMHDVAETIGIALPSASVMVERLEGEGLLVRTHDPKDRRVVRVNSTPKGRQLIQSEIEISTKTLKNALLDLSERDKRVVLKFFRAHLDAIREQSES